MKAFVEKRAGGLEESLGMAAPRSFRPRARRLPFLTRNWSGPARRPVGFHHREAEAAGQPETGVVASGCDRAEGADLPRSLAYLRTYVRLTGGRPLPAGGLRLHKDRIWLDRAIVSQLERDGFLGFEAEGHFEPSFVVTEKGQHWIATGEIMP